MPKVRFTSSPKIPNDMAKEWEGYVKDSVHEMSELEYDRWLARGVVEIVRDEEVKEEVKPEVKIKEEKVIQSTTPKVSMSPTPITFPNPPATLPILGGKSTSV